MGGYGVTANLNVSLKGTDLPRNQGDCIIRNEIHEIVKILRVGGYSNRFKKRKFSSLN